MSDPLPRTRPAPAKINLTLAVTGRRADGFHLLESVFLRIGLADVLNVTILPDGRTADPAADELAVEGEIDCPPGENLVLRAVRLLRLQLASPQPRLRFGLRKQVPVGAGLGGGSSDAAAALSAAAGAWGAELPDAVRLDLAAQLGSDVPFFASGAPAALVRGRGERDLALPPPTGDLGVLLVTPRARLPTGSVFAAWDARPRTPGSARGATSELAARMSRELEAAALAALAVELREANDLWEAAASLDPTLPEVRRALESRLGRAVLLSGSGPTLVALYPSSREAAAAVVELAAEPPTELRGAKIIASDLVGPDPLSIAESPAPPELATIDSRSTR